MSSLERLQRVEKMSLIDRAKYESVFRDLANLKPIHKRVNNIEIEVPIEGGNSEFNFSGLNLDLDFSGNTKYDVGNFKNKALQDINN